MKNVFRKFGFLLFILFVCMVFTGNVFASEFDFTLSANANGGNTVSKGSVATITVNLKSDKAVAHCVLKFSADDTLEFVSKSGIDNWKLGLEGTNGVEIENSTLDTTPLTSGKNIMTLKYKVNGDGKITISTKECVSMDDKLGTQDDVVVSLKSSSSTGGNNNSSENNSGSTNNGGSSNDSNESNVSVNPGTGDIGIFVLIVLLMGTFISSFIYMKRLKNDESK